MMKAMSLSTSATRGAYGDPRRERSALVAGTGGPAMPHPTAL